MVVFHSVAASAETGQPASATDFPAPRMAPDAPAVSTNLSRIRFGTE